MGMAFCNSVVSKSEHGVLLSPAASKPAKLSKEYLEGRIILDNSLLDLLLCIGSESFRITYPFFAEVDRREFDRPFALLSSCTEVLDATEDLLSFFLTAAIETSPAVDSSGMIEVGKWCSLFWLDEVKPTQHSLSFFVESSSLYISADAHTSMGCVLHAVIVDSLGHSVQPIVLSVE